MMVCLLFYVYVHFVEAVKERPLWNVTNFFMDVAPNTPYLHQLPCSWGALFMPKKWQECYKYMNMRYREDAEANLVQILKAQTKIVTEMMVCLGA